MYSDYKTTITYFIVVLAFIYSVYMDKPTLIDIIIVAFNCYVANPKNKFKCAY